MNAPYALRGHGRFDYSAIVDRPDFSWPQGKRLAVYLALNLEHFSFGDGLGASLAPPQPQPDVLNHAWREYGNRVGAWRMLELFDELRLPVAALVNTALLDHCPALVQACVTRGYEIVGHGHTNAQRQGEMGQDEEARLLRYCRERLVAAGCDAVEQPQLSRLSKAVFRPCLQHDAVLKSVDCGIESLHYNSHIF